jgi:hypothetical protein
MDGFTKIILLRTAQYIRCQFRDTHCLLGFPFLVQPIHMTQAASTFQKLPTFVASCHLFENTCEPL